MRKAGRVLFVVLFAYLTQTTVLPYFKISGVMLDLLVITLCCVGFALGMYAGVTAGLLAALVMESVSGDLSGLTAVACIGAGAFGAWVQTRISEFTRVGNRTQERLVKRFAPMVAFGLFIIAKETIYVLYFYLTGVDIVFIHIFRVLFAGLETTLMSLILLPLIYWFLLRKPENTFIARWIAKRRAKGKAKLEKKAVPPLPGPQKAPARPPVGLARETSGNDDDADESAEDEAAEETEETDETGEPKKPKVAKPKRPAAPVEGGTDA